MRNTTTVLNSIVVAFFTCFLTYTFVARQHLDGLARGFVTEQTLRHSEPIVELADALLDSPLAKGLFSDEQAAAIRHEIDEYRNDAPRYIADLTRQARLAPKPEAANVLLDRVASIKEQIRTFYDNTLAALITDLRIFSTSSLCAGLVALWLSYRSRKKIQNSGVWFSFLMCVSVLYCSYLYIDELSFFRILIRAHMGWLHPVVMCVALAQLYLQYGRLGQATGRAPAP